MPKKLFGFFAFYQKAYLFEEIPAFAREADAAVRLVIDFLPLLLINHQTSFF